MDNKIVIHKSRKKATYLLLFSLLVAIIGWLIIQYSGKNVVGWSIIILAGLCFILGIGNWFDRKPYIVLTESGLTVLNGTPEEIEWSAIRYVDDLYYRGAYFVRLLLARNYKPDLLPPTWFYRFDKLYAQNGLKAIYIRMGLYEISAIKFAAFIHKMTNATPEERVKLLHNFQSFR